MHPSAMDKRTKEYKEWAAKEEAKKRLQAQVQAESKGIESAVDLQYASAISDLKDAPGSKEDEEIVIDVNHKEPLIVSQDVRGGGKKPTRPWERMNERRPWRRDYFALKKKHDGFRCRFVDPKNVESRLQRGYVVADPSNYGGLTDLDIRDSGGVGKVLSRHGMILMEIPEEGARAYERHQEDLIRSRERSTKEELEREATSAGTRITRDQ